MTETTSVLVPLEPVHGWGLQQPKGGFAFIRVGKQELTAAEINEAVALWNTRAMLSARPDVGEGRFKDEDWPLALQRLAHGEPGPDQGLDWVGCDDIAFALDRLAHFAQVAMENAARVGELEAALALNPPLSSGGGETPLAELRQWCVQRAEAAFIRAQDPRIALSLQTEASGWAATFADVIERIDDMNPARAALAPPPPSGTPA